MTAATLVSIDGALRDPAAATVSVLDRGFLYGDGVFEILRTHHGFPFALEEHLGRMSLAARSLGIAMPVPISRWIAEVRAVLSAWPHGDATLRLMLTRGEGAGVDAPPDAVPTRVIVASTLPSLSPSLYDDGVRVVTVSVPWTAAGEGTLHLRAIKSLGYGVSVMARREARARGVDEALLVGADGVVFEAAAANVFAVHDGALHTPPVADGVLPGITRQFVIDRARARGVTVRDARMTTTDLWTADEVFLTSSVRGVVPVVHIDDHEVADARPGPVTRAVLADYRALTRAV